MNQVNKIITSLILKLENRHVVAEIREIAYKNIKGNAKFNYRIVMLEMLEIFEKFIDQYEKY
jgi:hypothetical protein